MIVSSDLERSIEVAKKWQAMDPNPTTAKYVESLVSSASSSNGSAADAQKELQSLFPSNGKRIEFGTAGLRSAMKPGPLAMNDLTVVQTAQGLAKWCLKQQQQQQQQEDNGESSSSSSKRLRAVVGYDHRCNPNFQISSLSFALLTALVFAEAGIDCILLDGFVLTPLVPFVVKQAGAACGVMVTASHNPKQDDGYKVYAGDACQIRAPIDKEIATEILDNLEPWVDYGAKFEQLRQAHPDDKCLGLTDPDKTCQMLDEYYHAIQDSGLKTGQAKITSSSTPSTKSIHPPTFAYTAMHGIGHKYAKRVFDVFDLPAFKPVPQQQDPDPTFPTVPFPNPEEKGALDLAKAFASDNNCDIVIANDPDADRLAVAEKDRSTGEWTVFTGDQIGTMLGHWIWQTIGKSSDKPVSMCVSTVSSKMLAEIGRVEGFRVEETLTGFKWIGSRSDQLTTEGYRNLFGYEEAIGFACGDVIFDKDGVSAMAVLSELALFVYREKGMSLKDHLQGMYDKYGEFVSYNGYFMMDDNSVVATIMDRLRANGTYKMDVGSYEIESIRDLGEPGYDSTKPDKKPTLPTSNSSPMMALRFTNGCVIQLRPSGTEPKFKFYIEMKGQPGVPRETVKKDLDVMVGIVLDKLMEPEKHGLCRA
mmetsp:Transcript_63040/g.153594  ORF Transcript_63040/g.153594 Transcript_63040/m.153594 type:complete len:645 (+) Transcript_63040:195-2129(+)